MTRMGNTGPQPGIAIRGSVRRGVRGPLWTPAGHQKALVGGECRSKPSGSTKVLTVWKQFELEKYLNFN